MPESAVTPAPAPAPAVPDRPVGGVAFLGLGTALPPAIVENADVAAVAGVGEDWIVKRTGIHRRRWAAPGDRLHALAARAAVDALAEAGLTASDLDLVLFATCTADEIIPHASSLLADAIGATGAGALDVGAACTGFLTALSLGTSMVEAGRARHVLVVGAEILSRHLDTSDRRTAALFGDGAGAVVIGAASTSAVGPILLRCEGSYGPSLHAERSDGFIQMDGPEVFKHAVARMGEATLEVCERTGVALDDIDLFVYHQANARILTALIERHDLPADRVVSAIGEIGNTSAASIPLALGVAREQGLLRPRQRVLLAAFGAGFTWGATVVTWNPPTAETTPDPTATETTGEADDAA